MNKLTSTVSISGNHYFMCVYMYCWLCPVFWVCVVYTPSAIVYCFVLLLLVRQRVKSLEVVFMYQKW